MSTNKVNILAVAAHPDDVELSCSGTLLSHIDQGKTVALVDLTEGELGTRGTPELRKKEAEQARKMMGARERINLGLADGFFRMDKKDLLKLIEQIRYFQPDIMMANTFDDRHPDHGRAATFVKEAAYLSGLRKIETTHSGQKQEVWRPRAIYHYLQDYYYKPDLVVDISDYIDRKMELIMAFKSQFYNPDSTEPESPISTKEFLDFIRARARSYGRPAGFDYGEGFLVSRTPGVKDLFHLF